MNPELSLEQVVHGSALWQEVVELRLKILRTPLGLTFTSEELDAEANDIQLVILRGERLLGCLLLTPQTESRIKMRQVAVDTPYQGQGIGKALVKFAEEVAKRRGYSEIVLNAREPVVPFYEKLGYTVISERFIEVTIPHFTMHKAL